MISSWNNKLRQKKIEILSKWNEKGIFIVENKILLKDYDVIIFNDDRMKA